MTGKGSSMDTPDNEIIKLKYFDWDKAKHFYHVAKFGSITEAARFLNTTQSSLSRKITLLEESLRCRLLTRHYHGVKATRKGEELLAIVEQTFKELKRFQYSNTVMSNDGQKRKIRISTTQAIAAYVLGEYIITYNLEHPEIIFEIITNDQLVDLTINDVDMAIRPYSADTKDLNQEPLLTMEKKLYASLQYSEKYGNPKTIEDLKNHYVISHAQPETHPYSDLNWILRLGMKEGHLIEPTFTTNSLENAVLAAQRGIGIIGSFEEMSLIKHSNLKRILSDIKGPIVSEYIMYPTYLENDQFLMQFKDFLIRNIQPSSN